VEMANLKGIPTINMAVEGWRENLDSVLSGKTKAELSLRQLTDALNEKFGETPGYGLLSEEDLYNMTPEEISNLKNCL